MYLIESAWEEMGDTESNLRSKATAVQPTYKINMLRKHKTFIGIVAVRPSISDTRALLRFSLTSLHDTCPTKKEDGRAETITFLLLLLLFSRDLA